MDNDVFKLGIDISDQYIEKYTPNTSLVFIFGECIGGSAKMYKKLTYDFIKNKLNNMNYELISNEKNLNKYKIIIKDIEGYYYSANFDNIIRNHHPRRFHISNTFTIYNIKLWCTLYNKSFKIISDTYVNNDQKLQWYCFKCKNVFDACWRDIQAESGCPYCVNRKVNFNNCLATKNPELAKEWHPTKNGDLTPYDVVSGSRKKVWWQCSKNSKHEWISNINSRNRGSGCPYCNNQSFINDEYNLLICNPEVCEEWNYIKNKKKPEDYYPNSGKKVWWKCKECGHEWRALIANRTKFKGSNCPSCAKSKGEKEISRLLNRNNVYYIPQKEFDGLIGLGGGLLSYDFYLPEYNLLIEFQGEQHEKFCKGIHNSKKDFEKQQEHDRRKREYAKNHNIKLLEIWYWDYDKTEEILNNEIKI